MGSPFLKLYRFGVGKLGGGLIDADEGIRLLDRRRLNVIEAADAIDAIEPRRWSVCGTVGSTGGAEASGDGMTNSTMRSCRAIRVRPDMEVGSDGVTSSGASSSNGVSVDGKTLDGKFRRCSTIKL